jgi:flagellar basal body rod protein FlgC
MTKKSASSLSYYFGLTVIAAVLAAALFSLGFHTYVSQTTLYRRQQHILTAGKTTTAYIDSTQRVRASCKFGCYDDYIYTVHFQTATGQMIQSITRLPRVQAIKNNITSTIVIRYDPEHPQNTTNNFSRKGKWEAAEASGFLGVVGLFALLTAVMGFGKYRLAKRRIRA